MANYSGPVISLLCLVDGSGGTGWGEWCRGLLPEVDVRAVPRGWSGWREDLGALPFALFASGGLGRAAFGMAVELARAGRPPMRLIVADAEPPVAEPAAESVPSGIAITAFTNAGAGRAGAARAARWSSVTTGPIAVRLLPPGEPGTWWAARDALTALKEELQVWPS